MLLWLCPLTERTQKSAPIYNQKVHMYYEKQTESEL